METSRNDLPTFEIQKHLAIRIAEIRTEKGLTQLQLSKTAGIALQFLTKIEQGDRAPSLRTIAALAGGLDVPVVELFNFEDRKIKSPRVEGQALRLRTQLQDASEQDVKLLNQLAQRLVAGPVKQKASARGSRKHR